MSPARSAARRIVLPGGTGELHYLPDFVSGAAAGPLLGTLIALPDWQQLRLRIYGRDVAAPRLTAWFGDPGARYAYSGIVHEPNPWPPVLDSLRRRLACELGLEFNSVLANRYRDGSDSMGWHSDDERELGEHPVIGSISLGAERRLRLRSRAAGKRRSAPVTLDLTLEHGSLLIMQAGTQRAWQHCLPKARGCRGERVNLTFRRIHLRRPSAQRSANPS